MYEHSCFNGVTHVLLVETREMKKASTSPGTVTASLVLGQVPKGRIADFQGTETYVHYFGEW